MNQSWNLQLQDGFKGIHTKSSTFRSFSTETYKQIYLNIQKQFNQTVVVSPIPLTTHSQPETQPQTETQPQHLQEQLNLLLDMISTYFNCLSKQTTQILKNEIQPAIFHILYNTLQKYSDNPTVVTRCCAVIMKIVRLRQTKELFVDSNLKESDFTSLSWPDLFQELLKSKNNLIFCKACYTIPSLINIFKQFNDEDVVLLVLKRMETFVNDEDIVRVGLWELWDHALARETVQSFILGNLPLLLKAMDLHYHQPDIQKLAFGVVWCLEKDLSTADLLSLFKRAFAASVVVQELNDLRPVIGVISQVLSGVSEEILKGIVKDVDYAFFFRILAKCDEAEEKEKEQERLHHLPSTLQENTWSSIRVLCRIPSEVNRIISLLKYSHLSPKVKARGLFTMTEANVFTEDLLAFMKELIVSTTDRAAVRILMCVLVYLIKSAESSQRQNLLTNAKTHLQAWEVMFENDRRLSIWLSWLRMHVLGQPYAPTSKIYFCPEKCYLTDISPDGLHCKAGMKEGFCVAITNILVSAGKWYFEVELVTAGLFQIGYVNDKFNPKLDGQTGVGDDEYSWAVDLYRNKKWHKQENTTSIPYAVGTKWKANGYLQCYLDLDQCIISFGYQGKYLGDAFVGFDKGTGVTPAFSADEDEECVFHFEEEKFAFGPDVGKEEFRPLIEAAGSVANKIGGDEGYN